ncbi:Ankyrin-2 [Tolypocladium ophioglossoides CBS 100239]|uniref:Ankyrin-2 n=1 Tax=Tolypocladium ophioglossoides (strain CBS 100239) TaxID=1163406 RepID=A0A0L0N3F9_TOLOC|nr:Ankyrin-2 [Tolypocladium ophioglossoides CBS 100239]
MDTTLSAASAIGGLLSLTIQITGVTQRHVLSITDLPRTATSYLEELVSLKRLLIHVQDTLLLQTSPTAEDLGNLASQALPTELAEFQTELGHIRDRLQYVQQHPTSSILKNLAWPFHDNEIAVWSNSLRRCRNCIQTAFLVSGLQLQATTLEEIRELRYRHEAAQKEELRLKILDWICDDTSRVKQRELTSARHPNTGQWVLSSPEFRNWAEGDVHTLWCHGNPGVGKSQLMSLVVDNLSKTHCVLFFYCDYKTANTQSETTVAAAFLRQLIEYAPSIPPALEGLYRKLGNGRDKLELDDIVTLIHHIIPERPQLFVVLDALDEYAKSTQRRRVLSLLRRLADDSVKVLISSRPHLTEIDRAFDSCTRLEIRSDVSDVRSYVEYMIRSSDELSDIMTDDLRNEAIHRVTEQAGGMFLLAVLQCTRLTHICRASELRRALKILPSRLEGAYEGSMQRIGLEPCERKSIAMATLSWLYHSKRQPSAMELLQALAIDPTEPILDFEDIMSRKVVLDVCAGLVVFDAESNALRFTHYSVHEFFETTWQHWFPQARLGITRTCLAYLSSAKQICDASMASDSIKSLVSSYPFLKYAAQHWGSHAKDAYHDDLNDIAFAFLENRPLVELASLLLDDDGTRGKGAARMFPSANLAVQLAARFGTLEVMNLLLERGHGFADTDPSGRTALHWASRGGFGGVVKALLRRGAEVDAKTTNGMTPLHWAAKHGHPEVVMDLIQHGANPAERTDDGRTALHWATSRGHAAIAKILLSDPRVDATCTSRNGWSPLHWAACSGNRAVVIHAVNYSSSSTLEAAGEQQSMNGGESRGHEEVVVLLLGSGVDPNSRNGSGQTALHWAAVAGNKKIVQLLLDYGTDRDALDVHGCSPWSFAADNDADESVLRMLSVRN